jgi:hypothetical protein
MVSLTDVLDSINSAFPIFSYGERHLDEFLDKYSFDQGGIVQRWEMFDRLSSNVMEFLRERFPTLGELNRSICCELQMSQLQDKITQTERSYECYCSIVARYSVALV